MVNILLLRPAVVLHPGVMLCEYLEFYEMSVSELAVQTGHDEKFVADVCNAKAPVTAGFALALVPVFGRPEGLWLALQANYEDAQCGR